MLHVVDKYEHSPSDEQGTPRKFSEKKMNEKMSQNVTHSFDIPPNPT